MAAKGRPWKGVAAELRAICAGEGTIVGAHKAEFDQAMVRHGDRAPWMDTLRLARHAFPDAPDHRAQTLRYMLGVRLPEAFGEGAHRAGADAWIVAEVVVRAMEALGAASLGEAVLRSREPVVERMCRFGKHGGTPWSEVPVSYLEWMMGQDFEGDVLHTARHWLARHAQRRQ